jgi:hypothetical protein
MGSKEIRITIRLGSAEIERLDKFSAENSMTRSAAARAIFLEKIDLHDLEKNISTIVLSGMAAMQKDIASLRQDFGEILRRDDLVKATNFLIRELKK